jgi:hypothetical protein
VLISRKRELIPLLTARVELLTVLRSQEGTNAGAFARNLDVRCAGLPRRTFLERLLRNAFHPFAMFLLTVNKIEGVKVLEAGTPFNTIQNYTQNGLLYLP